MTEYFIQEHLKPLEPRRTFEVRARSTGVTLEYCDTWEAADRLCANLKILDKATEVFGSHDAAAAWFNSPQFGLGWRRPVDKIATKEGAQEVDTLLTQIEYGVYT